MSGPLTGRGWHLAIDRGGTFTDIVATDPTGAVYAHKVLSRDPAHPGDAAVRGIEELLARHAPRGASVESVPLGTTVATNALLERSGEPTLLVTTRGLRDVLRIGQQHRPDIFAREIRLPPVLYARAIEARERLAADVAVVEPIANGVLTVEVQGIHKLWALKSTLQVPLADIRSVRHDPERANRIFPGFRVPGTHIQAVYTAGTYYQSDFRPDFWSVRHREQAIVIQCREGAAYDEIILEVANPAETVARIQAALTKR